jgi:nucleoside-diphosphate-sugar epimerase
MILVTGGTGLVGSHLLYKLICSNEKVKAIYRNSKKLDNVKNVFSVYTDDYETLFNKIEWIEADLLNIPQLIEAFKNVTYVYHCAAFVSFEPNKFDVLKRTNIDGTANIVNLCLSENIEKLCHVSSIATLGNTPNNAPINEGTIWNPEDDNNVYAISKYGAEMEVWRGTQEGLNVVIVNPGVILGAGIWRYGTGNLFKKAHKGLKYYTEGTVALIDVKDVVNIMITLLKSDIKNERFVLVSENWTYKKFLQSLAQSVNVKPPKKVAKPWLLNIAWKLDWLKNVLTGKRRQLTKFLSRSLNSKTYYSNEKIKLILNYKFEKIDKSINDIGSIYLKKQA